MSDVAILVLAAGKGSRMGGPKALLKYKNSFWILRQLEDLQNLGLGELIVVLGHEHERVSEILNEIKGSELRTVVNPHPDEGQFSSLQIGLKSIPDAKFVFVIPVDTPCPSKDVWESLLTTGTRAFDVVQPVFEGKGGHPVLISQKFAAQVLKKNLSDEDARLDLMIRELPRDRHARVDCFDPRVLMNLNTPYDLQAAGIELEQVD